MYRRRNFVFLAGIAVLLLVIMARLTQMQLIWGRRFEHDYRAPAGGDEILDTVRGRIITADGEVLAKDVVSYDIAVHYSRLESDGWIESVVELTGESAEVLRGRAENIKSRVERIWRLVHESTRMEHLRIVEQEQYHPLVRDVPREVAVRLNSMRDAFDGIKVQERSRREYAGGDMFPHIVGRSSRISAEKWEELFENNRTWTPGMQVEEIGSRYRMDDILGVSGLERRYEDLLRGRRGHVVHRIEFHPFRVERVSETQPPEPGKDIHLTLRADFQEAVMNGLRRAAGDPGALFRSGSAVVLDANTGAVLAAGTWPSYSYEEFATDYSSIVARPHSPLFFRPLQAALPTGSVYKLITAIAALEEDEIHAGTVFDCEGRKRIHNRWFGCLGYHRRIGLEEAIERSCNVYFYEIALRLSGSRLSRWGREFGFGRSSGVDWPGEVRGSLETPDSVFARINLSIGQARFLASSLQVARMTAAIANGGILVTPHFLDHAKSPNGDVVRDSRPGNTAIPLSEDTLKLVRAAMERVVDGSGGTARDAGLSDFRVAGKTGTAELGAGRPNHAWFAGYAPHDEPRIAFAVVSERTEGQGGGHAAPIMGWILEEIWSGIGD